jgi:hypothetical protein
MKKIYTHENRFLVSNAQNIIEAQGIVTILKNEFAQGAVGEVAAFDAWLEVWVNDNDYAKAEYLIQNAFNAPQRSDWICNQCQEKNDASFEVCWQCQNEKI